MVILWDAEKTSDKTQHPLMVRALKKLGIEETYANVIKAAYDKLCTN
jgi:hypothetical protein